MNSRYTMAFLAWSFSFIATTSPATAEILFEHPFPDHGRQNAWCSSCASLYRVWDQFDLATDATITDIEARLFFYLTPAPDAFPIEYSIWNVTRTTQLFAQSFFPSQLSIDSTFSSLNSYDVFADIGDLPLTAGSYTLSIYSGTGFDTMAWWNTETTVHGKSFQTDGGAGNNLDMAFRIIGTIPEPMSIGLLVMGSLCLLGQRRVR